MVALLCLGLPCGCSSRPHLGTAHDGGPAVVVVDRRPPDAAAARPAAAGWGLGAGGELVEEREPNDDLAHAQPIEFPRGIHGKLVGTPGAGAGIVRPDVDTYQWLAGVEGRSVARIELSGPPEVTLEVLDRNCEPVVRGLPGMQVFPNLALSPGDLWFFRVRSGRSTSLATAEYRLQIAVRPLQPGDEEEPNESQRRATALSAGGDMTGYFGWGHDEDWLKLPDSIAAGSTLRIELSPVEGVVPGLRLREAGGTLVAEVRGFRGEELRLRNAPAPAGGSLVLRGETGANPDVPWQLHYAVEPPLSGAEREPNNTVSSANPVPVDLGYSGRRVSVAGFLWPGDVDVFVVRPSGPGLLDVELQPPEGVDLRLEQLAQDGRVSGKVDKGGAGKPERLARVPVEGDVLLRVGARPRDTAFDAPYLLILTPSLSLASPSADDPVVNERRSPAH